MVAMEQVMAACSLTLFLVIYLLTSNGIRNLGALATQGEQRKCSYHFEGNRKKKTSLHVLSYRFVLIKVFFRGNRELLKNLIKFICLKTCSFLVQSVESLNPYYSLKLCKGRFLLIF